MLYEQRWSGCSDPSLCYEVIRIRRREGFWIDGRSVEPAEVYPNSEAWGVDGFTIVRKEQAFAKLRGLARRSVKSRSKSSRLQSSACLGASCIPCIIR